MQKSILVFITAFWSTVICFGQATEPSATSTNSSLPISTTLYQSATALSPHLYNGNRYHIYDSPAKDHQFFQVEEWAPGFIDYDGQLFQPIPMLYDIVKDQVVIKYQERSGLIQLQSERVKEFSYIKHRFIRLEENKEAGLDLPTGFYDVLYEGKTQLLARRTKLRQEQIEENKVKVSFIEKNAFYVKKDSIYHAVHGKGSALGLFADQKKALKKHLREQHIKYRKDQENALLKMTTLYDQLAHP